jgi:hypothetical protein
VFSLARFQHLAAVAVGASVVVAAFIAPIGPPRTASAPSHATAAQDGPPAQVSSGWVQEAYAKLPLSFEKNVGQTDPKVDFLARGSGYTLFLAQGEAVLALRSIERPADATSRSGAAPRVSEEASAAAVLRMGLAGGNPAVQAAAAERLPGTVNYFIGNDPDKWHVDVPTYARITYPDVYPGVDLVYYGDQGRLEYDLVVKPGADPALIALRYAGAETLEIDARGDLVLGLGAREVRHRRLRQGRASRDRPDA